jgi:adenosylmethionine-8-amino-7-oxononanoate aminotransferase
MATMTEATISGERIEELQSIAGDHLFMHAQQIEDWRGSLKIFVKGEGAWVEDIEGNRVLDAMGGLWYKAAGYGRTEIADAMYEQLTGIETPPANSATPSQIELAGRIAALYHDKDARTFFLSGGSEAVETAVKMAKKYQALNGKAGAFKVISRRYSYHGATAMAVSLGRSPSADPCGPEMPGAIHVTNWDSYRLPFEGDTVDVAIRCADEFEVAIKHNGPETVAAMIAEPISAAAGIHIPPPEYWQRLREIADEYDVVLIADEVITGFGRTGEYFAPMNWDVEPDITTVAKSLTSGYSPLGATIATKNIADAFLGGPEEMFRHLVTFGGHPVSAAAALANLDIFEDEDLPGNSKRMGEYLYNQLQRLREHQIVGDVRGGLGLLAAVELVQDRDDRTPFPASAGLAKRLPPMLFDSGLVTFRAGDVIALCPPLVIDENEVDYIVDALDRALATVSRELGIA